MTLSTSSPLIYNTKQLFIIACLSSVLAGCGGSDEQTQSTEQSPSNARVVQDNGQINDVSYNPNRTVNEIGGVTPNIETVQTAVAAGAVGIREPDPAMLTQMDKMATAAVSMNGRCSVNERGHKRSEWGIGAGSETILTPVQFKTLSNTIVERRKQFIPHVNIASVTHSIDPLLIHAIITQESAYNPKAVSDANARGLMQLMPNTARELGVTDAFDPGQNVNGGTRYIKNMIRMMKGDIGLALASYNAGPGYVQWCGYRVPVKKETQDYVRTVSGYYNYLAKNGGIARPPAARTQTP